MERNSVTEHQKSSTEDETDRAGTGRSYECVFCKRGFTTAQALGGHMNIHRKDRAKPRPKFDGDYYAALRGYTAIEAYPPPLQVHCQSWGFRPPMSDGFYVERPQILNRVEEDWPRSVGLQIGPSDHGRGEGSEGADELDLELRLGHHHP